MGQHRWYVYVANPVTGRGATDRGPAGAVTYLTLYVDYGRENEGLQPVSARLLENNEALADCL